MLRVMITADQSICTMSHILQPMMMLILVTAHISKQISKSKYLHCVTPHRGQRHTKLRQPPSFAEILDVRSLLEKF